MINLLLLIALLGGASCSQDLCQQEKCLCGYNMYKNTKTHFSMDCSENEFDTLPNIKEMPEHFDELDVSQNNIKLLTKGSFASATLKVLIANHNEITEVSMEFLKRIPNLKHLDLSHNHLKKLDAKVFQAATSLHHLDLSFNKLSTLQDGLFKPVKTLQFLDLSYNNVGSYLMNLKDLHDPKLGITKDLPNLKLNRLNITDLPTDFFTNSSLIYLSLDDNRLKEIPKLPYTIQYLDLSGNLFTTLNVKHLNYHKLKKLRLTRLPLLEKIEKYAFYNLQDLEFLYIENCPRLMDFNDMAFGALVDHEGLKLKSISLAGNALNRLNTTYYHLFNDLERVDLSNNPWICDCDILWFKLIKNKLMNKNSVRCALPSKLRNSSILTLTERDLPKCTVGSGWNTHKVLVSIIAVLCAMLVAIVAYIIYLGPFKSVVQNKFVGTQSPYTVVVREDMITT
ncbi:PREDICTED: leucine-rich alpha-2-glycoprotein-like [Nicrophorus vespilloides]|uniref:Leucine-rich alpha-2-glycoprotein-like n=1 Tax=Nicrophorus vespilloides TaxID=110193 RepID=A0ABM1MR62_NICVS|nr:PREDICTED: leucine-rich alpha-2-glycoprotein-like [Nicrophorus vespilloides]